jgi:hypothetical protein
MRREPVFEIPPEVQDSVIYLEFMIGTDGRPEPGSLRVVDAAHRPRSYPEAPGFEQQIWEAVKHWEFQPARLHGSPVRVLVTQPVVRRRPAAPDSASSRSLPNRRLKLAGEYVQRNRGLPAW